jgi:amidase
VTSLCDYDAIALAGMLRRREVSASEVVTAHIERVEAVNGAVNALVTRSFGLALAKAAGADESMARGEPAGLLHGLPVAHKDLNDTAGVRTTYGSPLFAGHVPERDALVVSRMAGAGAISLGKTNTPEFGSGSHTVNRVFGATRNPFDLTRSTGGSSGGAAAALAARMICLADGSDLGGSLRNPASFCNVVGLRPSPGRAPSWPLSDTGDMFGVDGPTGHLGPCRVHPWRPARRAAAGRQAAGGLGPATDGTSRGGSHRLRERRARLAQAGLTAKLSGMLPGATC